MTDRLTQIGEMAHGTVRHEDVSWMIDEIERLRVMPTQRETITLRRRGQRGKPGHEEYRVEELHNRREPLVGSDLTPEDVDDLRATAGRCNLGSPGYTLEQLVEAAAAYPTLLHRHLDARGECAASVDNLRKMLPLGDGQNPLADGTIRPWPVATHAAERDVLARRELSDTLEAYTICSEALEIGAAQHGLSVDAGVLTELRVVATPTRELLHEALLASEKIRMEATGCLTAERSTLDVIILASQ